MGWLSTLMRAQLSVLALLRCVLTIPVLQKAHMLTVKINSAAKVNSRFSDGR